MFLGLCPHACDVGRPRVDRCCCGDAAHKHIFVNWDVLDPLGSVSVAFLCLSTGMGAAPTSAPRCCAASLFSACPVFRAGASSRVAPLVCALCSRPTSVVSLLAPRRRRVKRPLQSRGIMTPGWWLLLPLVCASLAVPLRQGELRSLFHLGSRLLALGLWPSALGSWRARVALYLRTIQICTHKGRTHVSSVSAVGYASRFVPLARVVVVLR